MANLSKTTKDHEEIQRWAEERGGKPSHVKSTSSPEEVGILRIDFPGFSGEGSLEEISWEDFFEKFDDRNLALVYQEETADGERSNFNKLISGESVDTEDDAEPRRGAKKASSKSAGRKSVSSKRPAKKAAVKSGGSRTAAKKVPAKRTASKTMAKKSSAPAKKTRGANKTAPAKKSAAVKKSSAKKVPAKKSATKKMPAKKVAAKSARKNRR